MNSKFILALLVLLGLAACGSAGGGPTITDGSGNPVRIGSDPNATTGPGSPGWPKEPAVSGR